MVIVLGSVLVQEAHLAEALTLSQQHVTRSRAEPGAKALAGVSTERPSMSVYEATAIQTPGS